MKHKLVLCASVMILFMAVVAAPLGAKAAIFNPEQSCASDTDCASLSGYVCDLAQKVCKLPCDGGQNSCPKGYECPAAPAGRQRLCQLVSYTQLGTGLTEDQLAGSGVTPADDVRDLVIKYINFLLPYLTLAAFVGYVYAGFLYVTSYGDEEQAGKSKNILTYASIGLVLVILSYAIVQFFTRDLVNELNTAVTPRPPVSVPGNPNSN